MRIYGRSCLRPKEDPQPLTAFCRKCQENGYPIYEMELILAGEEFYATMKRSTNGRWRELTDVGGGR